MVSVLAAQCAVTFASAISEENKKMESILSLGDENYRYAIS